jgi:two-component system OmpR family response regulator
MSEASPHLLVVDDHREIRDLVAKYLARHDYRVSVADSAAAARRVFDSARIDLVVLDIMMPREDGLSLCRQLRAKSDVPIIMLTAMAEDTDRVVGLELGADDYVTKPFNPRELLARIKAVLRRTHALPPQPERPAARRLRFDHWILDAARRELVAEDGVGVPLSTGEFLLLTVFLRHPGMVLSRDQLLDLTRGRDAAPFDRSIDNQVSRLRKKIERDPRRPQLIKTHWGGGYSFTADVREAPPPPPPPSPP